ncbi:MAG TPA: hypothetical protein VNR11_06735 [Xanthobacteraceae bacterium]|nr:hypothetical protein [Xanthobacteraceae bacterium]
MSPNNYEIPDDWPPVDPAGERVVEGEAAFAAECLDLAKTLVKGERKFAGAPVITWTPKWGLVWRADYDEPGSRYYLGAGGRLLIHRVMCWKMPNGTSVLGWAYFQDVPPLHPPSHRR